MPLYSMKAILFVFFTTVAVIIHCSILRADFEETANLAGFVYDSEQDIYISKIESFQRSLGYHKLFDFFAPLGGVVIDTEPIIFFYDGGYFMIELWKGQYFAATGAEIGIYRWNGLAWTAVENEDMMQMSYTLKRGDEILFTREGRHWWLAGFFPGKFSHYYELILEDVYIEFKTKEMRNAFLIRLYSMGYDDENDNIRADDESRSISFNYTRPKSRQADSPFVRRQVQRNNLRLVNKYNDKKAEVNGVDNSPATIDKILRG